MPAARRATGEIARIAPGRVAGSGRSHRLDHRDPERSQRDAVRVVHAREHIRQAPARWATPTPVSGFAAGAPAHATSARLADGRRVWFVHNWSAAGVTVTVPFDAADLLTGDPATGELALGEWDVRVLVSRVPM
jgi:beta-galactosidase GanA